MMAKALLIACFCGLLCGGNGSENIEERRCYQTFSSKGNSTLYIQNCPLGEVCLIKYELSKSGLDLGISHGCGEGPTNQVKETQCVVDTTLEYGKIHNYVICFCRGNLCNTESSHGKKVIQFLDYFSKSCPSSCPKLTLDYQNTLNERDAIGIKSFDQLYHFEPCDYKLGFHCELTLKLRKSKLDPMAVVFIHGQCVPHATRRDLLTTWYGRYNLEDRSTKHFFLSGSNFEQALNNTFYLTPFLMNMERAVAPNITTAEAERFLKAKNKIYKHMQERMVYLTTVLVLGLMVLNNFRYHNRPSRAYVRTVLRTMIDAKIEQNRLRRAQ